MYTGAGAKKSDIQKRDEAFARSRGAAIVLAVTAGFTAAQAAILFFNLPPGVIEQAADQDEQAALLLGTAIYVALYCVLALVLMLFAWLMRSRVAMALGLTLYALNWINFVMELMAGQFQMAGLLMNVVGPYFIIRSIFYATRYHSMRKRKAIDPEVFA
jgi:uncharacterized membrane protein